MNILKERHFHAATKGQKIKDILGNYYLVFIFIFMFIACYLLSPKFLTKLNLINILTQNATTAILSFGMLFVIITGGIDLSVGSLLAFSVCLSAGLLNQKMYIWQMVLIVFFVMAAAGFLSGSLVAFGKIEPFIVTLAMQQVIRGLAYIYQVGSVAVIDNPVFLTNFAGNLGPIPIPVIYAVVVGVILHFTLKKTTFGRKVYTIGGNKDAAKLVGISVPKVLIGVYMLSAILAGFAGIVMAARLRVGTALVGEGMELDAIASVVIGGAAFTGGRGIILNTILGVLILGLIGNIMNLLGVATYPQMMIKGALIVAAVLIKRN